MNATSTTNDTVLGSCFVRNWSFGGANNISNLILDNISCISGIKSYDNRYVTYYDTVAGTCTLYTNMHHHWTEYSDGSLVDVVFDSQITSVSVSAVIINNGTSTDFPSISNNGESPLGWFDVQGIQYYSESSCFNHNTVLYAEWADIGTPTYATCMTYDLGSGNVLCGVEEMPVEGCNYLSFSFINYSVKYITASSAIISVEQMGDGSVIINLTSNGVIGNLLAVIELDGQDGTVCYCQVEINVIPTADFIVP